MGYIRHDNETGSTGAMKIFLDTADVAEIREFAASGLVDGVTTNPSLAAKTGKDYVESLKEICALVPGPISAEVLATDHDGMMAQAKTFLKIAPNIAIKVPLTWDGLKACKALSEQGATVNVTLCFSPVQAMMAAKAGASFISPFIGRLDDIGEDGMTLVRDIRTIYDNYGFKTEILAASVRGVNHVLYSALAGADIATVPGSIFKKLLDHTLTEKGLAAFLADAQKAHVTIQG
jgi:transaldolase